MLEIMEILENIGKYCKNLKNIGKYWKILENLGQEKSRKTA